MGVDYQKTLIYITIALYQFANREVKLLLVTLCEMIEIYYAQEEKRSPKMIHRLHNLCWRHAIQCRRVLIPPKKLTYRKLFGLHFHSCITHSAQLLRLASHRSTNAEMFEILFEKLSDITTKTWSKRIEDLSKMQSCTCKLKNQTLSTIAFLKRSEKLVRWQSPFPSWITLNC